MIGILLHSLSKQNKRFVWHGVKFKLFKIMKYSYYLEMDQIQNKYKNESSPKK